MTLSIWSMRRKAREFYPTSRHMRHQWLRQSVELLSNEKHLLQTGSFKPKNAVDSGGTNHDSRQR